MRYRVARAQTKTAAGFDVQDEASDALLDSKAKTMERAVPHPEEQVLQPRKTMTELYLLARQTGSLTPDDRSPP
jgi:hypothetical protein